MTAALMGIASTAPRARPIAVVMMSVDWITPSNPIQMSPNRCQAINQFGQRGRFAKHPAPKSAQRPLSILTAHAWSRARSSLHVNQHPLDRHRRRPLPRNRPADDGGPDPSQARARHRGYGPQPGAGARARGSAFALVPAPSVPFLRPNHDRRLREHRFHARYGHRARRRARRRSAHPSQRGGTGARPGSGVDDERCKGGGNRRGRSGNRRLEPVQADRAGDVRPQRDLDLWPVEGCARRRRAPAHPDRAASQLAVRDRAAAARPARRHADSCRLQPARGLFYAN